MDGGELEMKTSGNFNRLFLKGGSGFTLVELMISMAISGVITAAIYTAYITQQRTHFSQEQVAEMQQNIRAAMDIMAHEIRMAGYDPSTRSGAQITTTLPGQFGFSMDLNGDGDLLDNGEVLDFGFPTGGDVLRDGIPDNPNTVLSLGRRSGGAVAYPAIADNIQAIEFNYLDATSGVAATPADVRAVQVTILARADLPDRSYNNTIQYNAASGNPWGPYNDNFRRRLLITTIQCRNMGL